MPFPFLWQLNVNQTNVLTCSRIPQNLQHILTSEELENHYPAYVCLVNLIWNYKLLFSIILLCCKKLFLAKKKKKWLSYEAVREHGWRKVLGLGQRLKCKITSDLLIVLSQTQIHRPDVHSGELTANPVISKQFPRDWQHQWLVNELSFPIASGQ